MDDLRSDFDMPLREFYIQRRREEAPVFLNVLKALPADRLSYKPHDRCPSAEQLVWTLTSKDKGMPRCGNSVQGRVECPTTSASKRNAGVI
jgi:hypothetical protein